MCLPSSEPLNILPPPRQAGPPAHRSHITPRFVVRLFWTTAFSLTSVFPLRVFAPSPKAVSPSTLWTPRQCPLPRHTRPPPDIAYSRNRPPKARYLFFPPFFMRPDFVFIFLNCWVKAHSSQLPPLNPHTFMTPDIWLSVPGGGHIRGKVNKWQVGRAPPRLLNTWCKF